MRVNSTKPPFAHFATNQKSDAKQKSEDGMKKATRAVIKINVVNTARHITTLHFPLGGNGVDRMPRSVSSMANTTCKNGTMKMATPLG